MSAFSATRTHVARDNITLQQILYIARDRVFGVLYLTAVISGKGLRCLLYGNVR